MSASDAVSYPRQMLRLPGLAALAALFTVTEVAVYLAGSPTDGLAGPWAGLVLPLVVALSLPLLLVVPRAVVATTVVAAALLVWSDVAAPGLLVPEFPASLATIPRATPIVIIWLVLHERPRVAYPIVAVLAALAARVWAPAWDVMPFGLLSTLLPAVAALWLDARTRLVSSLRDRAERAEREQELIAGKVRAEERRRLATEMHDVVTHRISAMVLHASALGIAAPDPAVRRAAGELRDSGTAALAELRDLIGVLHEDGSPRPSARDDVAPPGSVEDLVRESAAGLGEITLDVGGPSSDDLSPTVERTVYRIVQEALTNVRKHAPGAPVTVEVHYGAHGVRVRVGNAPGRGPIDPALAGSGSGRGLTGLEQRVELVGGTVTHGPTDDGGFTLTAALPTYVPTTRV